MTLVRLASHVALASVAAHLLAALGGVARITEVEELRRRIEALEEAEHETE